MIFEVVHFLSRAQVDDVRPLWLPHLDHRIL